MDWLSVIKRKEVRTMFRFLTWQLCGEWFILQQQGVQVGGQIEGIVVAGNDTFFVERVEMEIPVEIQWLPREGLCEEWNTGGVWCSSEGNT